MSKTKAMAVRHVKAAHVGSLIKLRGVVVRVSEVKPLMSVCTFTCDKCGYEIYQEVSNYCIFHRNIKLFRLQHQRLRRSQSVLVMIAK